MAICEDAYCWSTTNRLGIVADRLSSAAGISALFDKARLSLFVIVEGAHCKPLQGSQGGRAVASRALAAAISNARAVANSSARSRGRSWPA